MTVIKITLIFITYSKRPICVGDYLASSPFSWNKVIRYKRPRLAAQKSQLHNFPFFIRFCNNQIVHPHNVLIKKIQSKLEEFQYDICKINRLIFKAIKLDILSLLIPVSKSLQETFLVMPKLMSVCRKVIKPLYKLINIVECDGGDEFYHDNIFLVTSEMREELYNEEEEIVPVRQTEANVAANSDSNYCTYSKLHGYIMKGSIEDAIGICHIMANDFSTE